MSRSFPVVKVAIGGTLFLLVVFGIFFFWKFYGTTQKREPDHAEETSPLYEPGDRTMKVYVKVLDVATGRLFNQQRTIYQSHDRTNQMRQVLLDYLDGPRTGLTQAPVPDGLKLNDFYLTARGEGVVDISISQIPPGEFGFYEEALFVRGLIDTLCENFTEIKTVKILVDGKDVPTLAGHYALGTDDLGGPVVQTVNSF